MKHTVLSIFFLCTAIVMMGQSSPNMINMSPSSPTTQAAGKLGGIPVNIYTGLPNVQVPIYSYGNSNNGLALDISMSYFAGGSHLAEESSFTGLNWFLNAGGSITRVVRGMPDDITPYGYTATSSIPTDFRNDGQKYYYDSLDREQDVFQYSFEGRSGKFFIGKNQQIVLVPASKIKIIPTMGLMYGSQQGIVSFRVITENGNKYDFKSTETTAISGGNTDVYNSGTSGLTYNSAWYLTQVISAFNTDTIKYNYDTKSISNDFLFPQTTFVRNSDGVRTVTYKPYGHNDSYINKIRSIVLPDKTTISFYYGVFNYTTGLKYFTTDSALLRIKISDTTFRNGYLFDYQTTFSGNKIRMLLSSITPYTGKEKMKSYTFFYNYPFFPAPGTDADTLWNKQDHWGFYNGASNGDIVIPKVNNYNWGANRDPSYTYTAASTLAYFYLPTGGFYKYDYELNDHYPYTKSSQTISINPSVSSQNTISLNQVFNSKHRLVLQLDNSVSRSGTAPISGSGNLICTIKSTDGSVTYTSTSVSMYDLFYLGLKSWSFNLPNGSYRLETQLSSGSTITGSFPVNINWENRQVDLTKNAELSGGLRLKKVTRYNTQDDIWQVAEEEEYKYVTEDGKSSGFLGEIPKYDYPYSENNSGTVTNYTVVTSDPINTMTYTQGSPVGYSRVEVYKGTTTHNLGKTVYEFTDLKDVNSIVATDFFPYTPQDSRDWGLGLPKKVSVFDSTGRLVKRTVNNFTLDTLSFQNGNFKSLKLGHSATTVSSSPNIKTFIGQEYYPSSGRIYLASVADTIFQNDGSVSVSASSYTYDTSFNVTKVTTSYNRNRGLSMEQRFYYPYNYTVGGVIGKLRDSGIISTMIAKENWITGDGNSRIVSGEFASFKQLSNGYIKPDTSFALETNKPVLQSVIGTFDPTRLNRNANYFKPQVIFPQYDAIGNPLQIVSAKTGLSNSVIMDYGQRYAVAKVSNASISDIAYSSFEADGSGNWSISSTARDSSSSLTGRKSYNLSSGNITKSSLSTSVAYLLTVWVKSGASVSVNGSALSNSIAQQNGWNLYAVNLSSISSVTISGSGLIDELRLHPKNANMVTYTYEPLIGITSETDANNTVIYTEYDNLNRIKLVRDKDRNIIKRYDYSDTTMTITITPVWTYGAGVCRSGGNGIKDSTGTDTNMFSDTYGKKNVITLTNQPSCCTGAMYKMINGVCEFASVRVNTSTTYMKINNPNGSDPPQIWVWRCIWHWEWSDGTRASDDFIEYNSSPCPLGGGAVEV